MKILFSTIFVLVFVCNPAFACRSGETWFDWKTMKTKRCDDQVQTFETLPWQDKHESCIWVTIPTGIETSGNAVCASHKFGACKAIVKSDFSKTQSFSASQYKCTEKLFFKAYERNCIPSLIEGLAQQCGTIKAKVSCCE